jgi:hypothetical protein
MDTVFSGVMYGCTGEEVEKRSCGCSHVNGIDGTTRRNALCDDSSMGGQSVDTDWENMTCMCDVFLGKNEFV